MAWLTGYDRAEPGKKASVTPAAAPVPPMWQQFAVSVGLPPSTPPETTWARMQLALRLNGYMGGKRPSISQMAFLLAPQPEVGYGGAAGPGKTTGLLMAALQHVDVPGYHGVLIRRKFTQMEKPGALDSTLQEWLKGTPAVWNAEKHTWTFPTADPRRPATLTLVHMEHPGISPDDPGDEQDLAGAQIQFAGIDEAQQFPHPYAVLFPMTRLRRLKDDPIPLRWRITFNPGGLGEWWIAPYFGIGPDAQGNPYPPPPPDRCFMQAFGKDNEWLDWDSYLRGLRTQDPITQAQLIDGKFGLRAKGTLFATDRIRVLSPEQVGWLRQGLGVLGHVLYWDKAATAGGGAYTAGVLQARVDKALYGVGFVVAHVWRGQWSPGERNMIMRQAVGIVRPGEPLLTVPYPLGRRGGRWQVWQEQEPGSGGKESALISVDDLASPDVEVHTERATGAKADRAGPFAAQMEGWNVGMVPGEWNGAYLAELRAIPNGLYWDQTDGSSGAYNKLALIPTAPALPASAPGTGRRLLLPVGRYTGVPQRRY